MKTILETNEHRLSYCEGRKLPYVVHKVNKSDGSLYWGRYFESLDAAMVKLREAGQ